MGCARSKLPCADGNDEKLKARRVYQAKDWCFSTNNGCSSSSVSCNNDNCRNPLTPHQHQQYQQHLQQQQQQQQQQQYPTHMQHRQPPPPPHYQEQSVSSSSSTYRSSRGVQTGNGVAAEPTARTQRRGENVLARLSGRLGRPRRLRQEMFDARVTSKYDIKALIGKGSFSRVVRVEHKASRYPFAMKLMPAQDGTGPFENELRILSRVDHPNVIRLIEVFRTDTRVYVVMELATGGELYDRIVAKGRFPERETSLTLRMILDGLAYLHRSGVTHRDLKPENLLYHSPAIDSKVLITDFGLAHQSPVCGDGSLSRHHQQQQLMNDPCGTPEYIAPEILGRVPYTNKVDLWAMGVICFILLSGSMPFDDENRTVLYRQILRCKYHFYPELWYDVSDEAKSFVAALLCLDPQRRLSAEQAIQHPWVVAMLSRQSDEQNRRRVHKSHSAQDDARRHRSRSTRSIRSVARSEAGHRVDRAEVERLHQDPEIRRILFEASRNHQHHLLQQSRASPHRVLQHQLLANGGAGLMTNGGLTNYGVV